MLLIAMKWGLALLLVFLVVSAKEKYNDIDLSFESCPAEGACPIEKCCTDFSCDNETLANGKSVKCCSLAELKNEQKISKENQNCSPCWKCRKNCPRKISILSNGEASTWEDKLGSYELIRYDQDENAIYKHILDNGNFLFKPDDNKDMWMVGNEVGKNFGWIGHSNCSEQCPTSCEVEQWKYWNGVTGGDGKWDSDQYLVIEAPPRKVAMEINGVSSREYTFKVKEEGVRKLAVDCIARQSTPLPRFEWKLDGKPIEDDATINERIGSTSYSGTLADYIETLIFFPKYHHDGKNLTCNVMHDGYANSYNQDDQNLAETRLKIHYPPVKKDPLERVIVWGEENKVQIQFNANPKPSHAYWTINGTRISIGTTSGNRKYISSPLLGTEDLVNGMWIVELTIRELTRYDSMKPHYLTVQNQEGQITYDFKLAIEQSPPPTLLPPSDWPLQELSTEVSVNACYKYETTYLSDDMAYNIGIENSAEECQRHCQNTTGCNHFSYEKEPRRCRLKKTSDEYDVQYSKNTIAGPKHCENGNIVVILVVVITSVFFFLIVFCCCCFLETSGEDPERYIVFKNDTLNVSRQMLPKVLENSSSLVFIVSLVEEWRDKILCIENRKNKSVIRCDETGVKIELNGVDINEEANGI